MRRSRAALMLMATVLGTMVLPHCASPTALTVTVYTDVGCAKKPVAGVVVGARTEELANEAFASTSLDCTSDGNLGSLVVYPSSGPKDGRVAVQVVTRTDGEDPATCTEATGYKGCIVARRDLRLVPNKDLQMRIDLRLACADLPCDQASTCVRGACVSATQTCEPNCTEDTLAGAAQAPRDSGTASDAGTLADAGSPVDLTGICAGWT